MGQKRGSLWWTTSAGLLLLVALALGATYLVRRRRLASSAMPDNEPLPDTGDQPSPEQD